MDRHFVNNNQNGSVWSGRRGRCSGTNRTPSQAVATGNPSRHDRHTQSPTVGSTHTFRPGVQQTHVLATAAGKHSYLEYCQTSVVFPTRLERPKFEEVSREAIEAVDADLKNVSMEHIHEGLQAIGDKLLKVITAATIKHPEGNGIIRGCEVVVNNLEQDPPTHVVAVPSNLGSSISFYSVHALVLVANCQRLSKLPSSKPAPLAQVGLTLTLPVVHLRVPDPNTFQILLNYLYSQDKAALLSHLFPYVSDDNQEASTEEYIYIFSENFTAKILMDHATKVHGLWLNMVQLGVFDEGLWKLIDWAWDVLFCALEATAESSVMPQPEPEN